MKKTRYILIAVVIIVIIIVIVLLSRNKSERFSGLRWFDPALQDDYNKLVGEFGKPAKTNGKNYMTYASWDFNFLDRITLSVPDGMESFIHSSPIQYNFLIDDKPCLNDIHIAQIEIHPTPGQKSIMIYAKNYADYQNLRQKWTSTLKSVCG